MMDLLRPYLSNEAAGEPPAGLDAQCDALLQGVETPQEAQSRLETAYQMVQAHPGQEAPQIAAARLLELTRRNDSMAETWAALHRRFPDNALAMRMRLRWLARVGHGDEGKTIVQAAFDRPDLSLEEQLLEADFYAELRDIATSDLCFETILETYPGIAKPRILYAKRLHQRGLFWEAGRVLGTIDPAARISQSGHELCRQVDEALKAARALPFETTDREKVQSAALQAAILLFRDRKMPVSFGQSLGNVAFVTGSLGAGGSERQMSRIARAMKEARDADERPGGVGLLGDIEVIVTDNNPAARKNFYQPVLEEADVALTVLAHQPEDRFADIGLRFEQITRMENILPKKTRYGLCRLTRLLRARKLEAIYLWQDGAVLLGALAALVAGVPRIVISLRGLPPNLRPYMMVDEYEDMYRALANVPGVIFSANSRAAAHAYADWLDLPRERFAVIPNASEPLPSRGGLEASVSWNRFDKLTHGGFTLGTVMRFHANKRPLPWIDIAAHALARHPRMRFVLVGSGPEFAEAQARAVQRRIDDRILFTGPSNDVGFWLSKMDAFLLLSEFEGLPNVLIEAQMAGVPVISTPAGGATETFDPDVTGFCLRSASNPDPKEVLSKITFLNDNPHILAKMSEIAARDTPPNYALPRILAVTTRLLKGLPIDARPKDAEPIYHAG